MLVTLILGFSGAVHSLNFSTHPAGQHHPDHFVVTQERPERVLKGSRLVFLDKEVTYPGGAVTWNQSERKKPPPADEDEDDYRRERDCGADQMKQARARLAVFSNVVWPKLCKRLVTLRHGKTLIRRLRRLPRNGKAENLAG